MSPLNVPFLHMSGSLSNSGAVQSKSKKFKSIPLLTLELRLLQIKCLNEHFISVIWGKVGTCFIIYCIKSFYFLWCVRNIKLPSWQKFWIFQISLCLLKKCCCTNNLFPMTPALNFNIWSLLFALFALYKATVNKIFSVVLPKWKQFP